MNDSKNKKIIIAGELKHTLDSNALNFNKYPASTRAVLSSLSEKTVELSQIQSAQTLEELVEIMRNQAIRQEEQFQAQIQLTQQTRKDNESTSTKTLIIAKISLIASISAVILGLTDFFGDAKWQNKQISELTTIHLEAYEQNKLLREQNKEIIQLLSNIKNKTYKNNSLFRTLTVDEGIQLTL